MSKCRKSSPVVFARSLCDMRQSCKFWGIHISFLVNIVEGCQQVYPCLYTKIAAKLVITKTGRSVAVIMWLHKLTMSVCSLAVPAAIRNKKRCPVRADQNIAVFFVFFYNHVFCLKKDNGKSNSCSVDGFISDPCELTFKTEGDVCRSDWHLQTRDRKQTLHCAVLLIHFS